jgi:hypothetical protein
MGFRTTAQGDALNDDVSGTLGQKITDGDRALWAMERYGPLNSGKRPRRVDDIARQYGRAPVVVNRNILKAFEDDLVEIREKPKRLTDVPRDERTEKDLQAAFGFVAIVPIVGDLSRLEASKRTDRTLHCMGDSFAQFLVSSPLLFRSGDVVGLGSGASIYYVVAGMQDLPHLRADGITIASVTGSLHATNNAGDLANVCDGDFHASLFAMRVLGKQAEVPRLMHTTLACPAERRDAMLKETWLGDWNKSPVSHLICGTGVLSRGHRLHLGLRPNNEEERRKQEAGFGPVADDLRKLSRISDEITKEFPGCNVIADVCNFLFYLEDTRAVARADEIRKLIDSVNRRLLTIQENELFGIESIMLLAGTEKKRGALAQLLGPDPFRRGRGSEHKRLKIRCLCTDQETGQWLLKNSKAILGH